MNDAPCELIYEEVGVSLSEKPLQNHPLGQMANPTVPVLLNWRDSPGEADVINSLHTSYK